METLDGVLYVKGGEGGRRENLEHELLGHPSVVARLVMVVMMDGAKRIFKIVIKVIY